MLISNKNAFAQFKSSDSDMETLNLATQQS